MSLICGTTTTMMMRRTRRRAAFQRSGSVTLPSEPSLRSQRPPAALSTLKNSSEPRSWAKDEDEDSLLRMGGGDWKLLETRALIEDLKRYQVGRDVTIKKRLPDVKLLIFMQVNEYKLSTWMFKISQTWFWFFLFTKCFMCLFMLTVFQTTSSCIERFPFCYWNLTSNLTVWFGSSVYIQHQVSTLCVYIRFIRTKSARLKSVEISQKPLDGLSWNLVQTYMFSTRWIIPTFVMLWLFLWHHQQVKTLQDKNEGRKQPHLYFEINANTTCWDTRY